ncbi:hypothetical protein OOK31_27240 [Streptomyces sp. NBC_00249]|uniref:hypothetical protein n=1 Tax=Streptomyces sp. NBC_00249 TaxID=2975690 RepID=UPI002254F7AA|nr:hypothetical protein [Streptomyces sp. NBC_00249]MCX5197548.1 hypothetical protein [Streptomyces sp. NBC_00249]
MRLKGRVRTWLAATAATAALLLVPGPPATADSPRPLAGNYLNLHQCVYAPTPGVDYITTVVPSRDGRFIAGTNTSAAPDQNLSCGNGDGNYTPIRPWASFQSLDLSAGRYLNLHQCVYYSELQHDHLTVVVSRGGGEWGTGTNVSNTADTTVDCGPGRGLYYLVPLLSSVKALDLTAGRYLNLQQCQYYYGPLADHFTTVITPAGDGRYSTGTKVSNTADTTPTCGRGNGNFTLIPLLSGTKALSRT